ncbi:MAG: M28 family metallopeptidase [Pseudomonadota bacterium]
MKSRNIWIAPLTAAFFLSACAGYFEAPVEPFEYEREAAYAAAISHTSDRLKSDVAFLADDALQGREAGTPGYDAAADYVAARLAGLGVAPGANGEWFQRVPFRTSGDATEPYAMSITFPDGETLTFDNPEDFVVFPSLAFPAAELEAPAVFAGFGVHAPRFGHDDYAGLDLDGKIVVRFGGAPDTFDSEERAHFGSGATKAQTAAAEGAVGVVTIYTGAAEQRFPWARAQRSPVSRSTSWVRPDGEPDVSGPGIVVSALLSPEAAGPLFEGAPKSYAEVRAEADAPGGAPAGFDLPITISLEGAVETEDFSSANVVGVIEGTDPALRNEALVITAHLDHIGVRAPFADDGPDADLINNGAMDNALGVAMLIETAKRFQDGPPPARTVVFLAVTAEEKGLLGADYFVHYPTLGDKTIVANVNLDMPVMLHEFTDIVAFGGERSELGEIAEAALADIGVTISPDPLPEQGIFTRSDHYRFVEKGVPSIFLWPGFANGGEEVLLNFLAEHYHQPSDDMALPVLWEQAARFADVKFRIAREIADAPDAPKWLEGDFFGELFSDTD